MRLPKRFWQFSTYKPDVLYPATLLGCRSAVAYKDVGEGREQDAEASPARFAARTPLPQVSFL